jgi:molecular chaperone DnaK (HSP70)
MGRIIGIDLGTTYSAVAIPEERRGDAFFVAPDCPGVSIIRDAMGHRITPSVVAEDPGGKLLVGRDAKARAGSSPAPIMFAKRAMGEDVTFKLKQNGPLRPEYVSARILAHLKAMAEQQLGERVDEAVITVPAYFKGLPKQMTEKAGELAGLRVAQVAPEPVAAALMYCAGDPRPNLRIMTYDLGGGTFDVAVLEKKDGVISTTSILAYDGDRYLGGYNFDVALALWFARKYGLMLEPRDEIDRVPLAKLMVLAETAKIALSKSTSHVMNEQATGIKDRHGKTMDIDLTLERKIFEDLIREDVERTMAICKRALNEKGDKPISSESIDEILMVGGSSRIPLVAERLEQEFRRKPKLIEPDLCVALGAAILAGTIGVSVGRIKLHPIPAESALSTLSVTGEILPGPELPSVAGCAVHLRSDDNSCNLTKASDAQGRFSFDQVELEDGETTKFTLTARSPQGRELAMHKFSVKRTDNPVASALAQTQIHNTLAMPIGIVTRDGTQVVAPARAPLPFETKEPIRAQTTSASRQIRVPIVEDNTVVGQIVMQDLPPGLEVGTEVQIFLTLLADYKIVGRATIPSARRETSVEIDLPKPVPKGLDELRRDLEKLQDQADDALQSAGAAAKFGDGRAARLKERMEAAKRMLESKAEDPGRIQETLDEIRQLTQDLGRGWKPEPPRAVFDRLVRDAREVLKKVIAKKAHVADEGYGGRIDAIVGEADKAYTTQNGPLWTEKYARMQEEYDKLEELDEGERPPGGTPTAAQLLLAMSQRLENLQRFARETNRAEEFKAEFAAVANSLKRIDTSKSDATNQLVDWHNTEYRGLCDKLMMPVSSEQDDLVKLMPTGAKKWGGS